MNHWISAGIAIVAGFMLGSIGGRIVRKTLADPARPEALRQIASAAAGFVFAILVAAGLLVGVGILSPKSLETMPKSLISYFPKVLVAGLTLLIGNVAATLASLAVRSSLLRATGEAKPGVVRIVKAVILSAAAILAVGQLGVNTTIVNLAVAALLFSIGATATLLIGLGGLDVASSRATNI